MRRGGKQKGPQTSRPGSHLGAWSVDGSVLDTVMLDDPGRAEGDP
jgi:hypothetical protein